MHRSIPLTIAALIAAVVVGLLGARVYTQGQDLADVEAAVEKLEEAPKVDTAAVEKQVTDLRAAMDTLKAKDGELAAKDGELQAAVVAASTLIQQQLDTLCSELDVIFADAYGEYSYC